MIRQLFGGNDQQQYNNMMDLDHHHFGSSSSIQNNANNTNAAEEGENTNNSQSNNNKRVGPRAKNASIEIDAFQLLHYDPVLGNLTLRYPDTLLELLEDSTVQARCVLRRRMATSITSSLERMKRSKADMSIKNDLYKREVNNMIQLQRALEHTKEWYNPRPLHARLTHLPPHMQCCKPTLSSISAADVGTVVQICGTCVKTGPVRMMETIRTYQCLDKSCGHKFMVQADFGTTNNALPQPIICPSDGGGGGGGGDFDDYEPCNSTSFAIVSNESHHADYQGKQNLMGKMTMFVEPSCTCETRFEMMTWNVGTMIYSFTLVLTKFPPSFFCIW